MLVFAFLVVVLPSMRLLYPFVPVATLIAAACFLRVLTPLMNKLSEPARPRAILWAMAVFALIQAGPLLVDLLRPDDLIVTENLRQLIAVSQAVSQDAQGPIVTDVPWWMAWYGHHTAIWLPRSWEDLDRMQRDIGQIRFLLLTPWVVQWSAREHAEDWARLWSQARSGQITSSHGFVVYRIYPGDGRGNDWILFVRSPRVQAEPAAPSPASPSGKPST
jgi:hypothetical protein